MFRRSFPTPTAAHSNGFFGFLVGFLVLGVGSACTEPEAPSGPVARFSFDGSLAYDGQDPERVPGSGTGSFASGLEGQALSITAGGSSTALTLDLADLSFGRESDFSVQFWVRTAAGPEKDFVVLSNKDFPDNSLASQKDPGWVFFSSGGTWAWNMGSGSRRITYERDNGQYMPLNDGEWHQLAMTYSSALAEVRLFYDGVNWVSYNVSDSDEFDFSNQSPLLVGWKGDAGEPSSDVLPIIEEGRDQLQGLVEAFNGLGLGELGSDELLRAVSDPRRLFEEKVAAAAVGRGADSTAFREAMENVDWDPVAEAESALMANPYTIHQNMNFTGIAPVSKVYALVDGKVTIRPEGAEAAAEKERLFAPEFEMDNLAVWDRVLDPAEVSSAYSEFSQPSGFVLEEDVSSLTAAAWNIWHGGKHWTESLDGWDSRKAIAEMLEEEGADVVMMQETYSSGDFIAAELGYYFATTVDWDYLNQGSNISVLSRYPILDLWVQEDSPFQNVGVSVALSRTQDLYVMSNWYGMDQFPAVFDFHQSRFQESDNIPTLFAGDFNAVPHTDGGESPASQALLGAGFTDAFRSLYQDVEDYPGPSHRSGRRIDQLYYKGTGLMNTSTKVISARPGGFPSDHFLILSTFDLDYSTYPDGR